MLWEVVASKARRATVITPSTAMASPHWHSRTLGLRKTLVVPWALTAVPSVPTFEAIVAPLVSESAKQETFCYPLICEVHTPPFNTSSANTAVVQWAVAHVVVCYSSTQRAGEMFRRRFVRKRTTATRFVPRVPFCESHLTFSLCGSTTTGGNNSSVWLADSEEPRRTLHSR